MIPTRSTVQVKTHAQMVMKRVSAGDDAFSEYYLDLLASPSLQVCETQVVQKVSLPSKSTRLEGLSHMDQQAAHILYQMAH